MCSALWGVSWTKIELSIRSIKQGFIYLGQNKLTDITIILNKGVQLQLSTSNGLNVLEPKSWGATVQESHTSRSIMCLFFLKLP